MKPGISFLEHNHSAQVENYRFLLAAGESHEEALRRTGMTEHSLEQRKVRGTA